MIYSPPKIIFSIIDPAPNITKISTNTPPQKQYRKTKLGAFSPIACWGLKRKILSITNEFPQQPSETR